MANWSKRLAAIVYSPIANWLTLDGSAMPCIDPVAFVGRVSGPLPVVLTRYFYAITSGLRDGRRRASQSADR